MKKTQVLNPQTVSTSSNLTLTWVFALVCPFLGNLAYVALGLACPNNVLGGQPKMALVFPHDVAILPSIFLAWLNVPISKIMTPQIINV